MNSSIAATQAGLLVAGHSHIGALIGERHTAQPMLTDLPTTPPLKSLDGPFPRPASYWELMLEAAADNSVALIWGGNEHNVNYFFQAGFEFDFLSRHVNKFLNSLQTISQARIRKRYYDAGLDELDALLKRLKSRTPHRFALVGTPPPKEDSEKLRSMLQREPYFVQWAGQIGEDLADIRITKPHVRLKLWFLLQDLQAELARKHGAIFVPVPAETQDGEGFLRPEFWKEDVTHANAAYGAILLRKVVEALG